MWCAGLSQKTYFRPDLCFAPPLPSPRQITEGLWNVESALRYCARWAVRITHRAVLNFFFFHKAPARGKRERSQKWEWRSGRRVQPGRVPEIWSESHTGGKVDPTGFFDYDNLTDAGTSRNANDDWKLSRVNKTVFKQWQLTEKTLTST